MKKMHNNKDTSVISSFILTDRVLFSTTFPYHLEQYFPFI